VRTVEQSSPLSGGINTITKSIKANCDLPAGSIVTIQQLTGSQTASSDALRIEAGNGGFAATGMWNGSMSDPESLVLTSTGMQVASTYEARFNLTNPATNQSSPGVSIKAGVRSVYGDFSPAASIAMDASDNTLLGLASGSKPLEVVVPAFEVRTVEQSSPLAGVINTITISIKANCDLPAGSIVTIQQLTGSQTASSDALRIEAGNGGFAATGVWNGSMSDPESLVLTSTGMQVASTYEARFNLTNPATNQSSPGVSIKAGVRSV
jgi:hypothetical protein